MTLPDPHDALHALFDTASVGLAILRQGRFHLLNGRLERMTGYPVAALLDRPWGMLFVDELAGRDASADWRQAVSGAFHSGESRWRRADGSEVTVCFTLVPQRADAPCQPGDALLIVGESTGIQRAPVPGAAHDEPRLFLDAAAPLCLLSLECRVLRGNRAFAELFGCSVEAALGRSCREFWDCDSCAVPTCPVEQLGRGEAPGCQGVDRVIRGHRLVCALHAAPYGNAAGQLAGVVVTFVDSRALRLVSADLLATRHQLIEVERLSAIGSLAASLAHEFNNPLCGIRSVFERMLRKPELTDSDHGLVRLALENCDRLSRMIRDLQQFNRPLTDDREQFDLHRVVNSVLLLLNKHLKAGKAVVRREFGGEVIMLNGSENQIRQAIFNLIKNSGEALPETGGEIRIRTSRDGDRVRIDLSDTGSGISDEHLPYLFEPFFTTKTAVGKTGLGLSVCRDIIQAHGGEILVGSPRGQGTTFTVILPAGAQG